MAIVEQQRKIIERQRKIRLLSDTELYERATTFMQNFERARRRFIPSTQMYGLVDIANADSYATLRAFVQHQRERTWSKGKEFVGEFYAKLEEELEDINKSARIIFRHGGDLQSGESLVEKEHNELMVLLVREFIQHLAAENIYLNAKRRA